MPNNQDASLVYLSKSSKSGQKGSSMSRTKQREYQRNYQARIRKKAEMYDSLVIEYDKVKRQLDDYKKSVNSDPIDFVLPEKELTLLNWLRKLPDNEEGVKYVWLAYRTLGLSSTTLMQIADSKYSPIYVPVVARFIKWKKGMPKEETTEQFEVYRYAKELDFLKSRKEELFNLVQGLNSELISKKAELRDVIATLDNAERVKLARRRNVTLDGIEGDLDIGLGVA